MCLGTKLSDRSLARYKAKGKKRGYIRVWKVVSKRGRKYIPEMGFNQRHNKKLYVYGLNHARKDAKSEQQLIHAFRDYKSAKSWQCSWGYIISVLVHPDWVMAIGDMGLELTLTTKAIVIPKCYNKKVTVAEFRAAIKGKKVKTYSWE